MVLSWLELPHSSITCSMMFIGTSLTLVGRSSSFFQVATMRKREKYWLTVLSRLGYWDPRIRNAWQISQMVFYADQDRFGFPTGDMSLSHHRIQNYWMSETGLFVSEISGFALREVQKVHQMIQDFLRFLFLELMMPAQNVSSKRMKSLRISSSDKSGIFYRTSSEDM